MTGSPALRVEHDVEAFGPEWDGLFAGGGVQSGRAWLSATVAAALPAGSRPVLLAVSDAAGPLALVPMLDGPGRRWGSLTTPYTCLYRPLWRGEPRADALIPVARYCRRWAVTRFEALDPAGPGFGPLREALRRAGLVTRSFAGFGNWHEEVAAGSWDDYLRARPGALRETVRRRTRAALRSGARLEVARTGPDLEAALRAYQAVYRSSWKQPEPFPGFDAALVRRLGEEGALRIGVMWSNDKPVAAQYWCLDGGGATVLKLAHDEAFKSLSPGTVLTAATIRELIEVDGVRELDFGRGDDAYKRGWAARRRPRVGLLALNPATPAGLRAWAVQDGGTAWRWLRRRAGRDTAGRDTAERDAADRHRAETSR